MIKPRPWWLFIFGSDYWVTISPHIYHPKDVDPAKWPAVVFHEQIHIWQQNSMGLWKWVWRYATNRRFRFSQEVEAMRGELTMLYSDTERRLCAQVNAKNLCEGYIGLDLHTACASYEEAYNAITEGIL